MTAASAAESERRPFAPRPAQEAILAYHGGYMGVSAVPGSGKTFTLSLLAARLVERLLEEHGLDEREVLVVTFTNSAVGNFRARIGQFLREERGMLPGIGYRVRTLHGLAHDIVRERPGLVGLAEDFDIVDERTASEIKRDAVLAYLRNHPDVFAAYIKPQYLQNPRPIERSLQDDAIDIANSVIRFAKERGASPFQLQELLDRQAGAWPLAEFGLHIYADYQRSLTLRGAVDFDDLILLAIQALRADEGYLARLQERWPYVLEDEAQDSSAGQERMLRMLTARLGNWVRVGDTNQAINTTFTSAEATFLVDFLKQHPEQARPLPNSGRSAQPIIDAANFLIDWSRSLHPALPPRLALTPPHIEPTPPGDPQPNPAAGTPPVYLHPLAAAPEKELEIIVRSAAKWLPDNPDLTLAVLAPDNPRCFAIVEALEQQGLPFDDTLLRTDSSTRAAAQALATLLGYIASPQTPGAVADLWRDVWLTRRLPRLVAGDEDLALIAALAAQGRGGRAKLPEPLETFERALKKLQTPETLIFPEQRDWLDTLEWLDEAPGMHAQALLLRTDLQRWTRAAILPVDELLLTLGNDIFAEPADLALAHRLAVLLAKMQNENPGYRLPELANELTSIAQNRRRILGFGEDAQGYSPKAGVITVATMHAAKGLEWDRVYLTAVNTYSFPSGGEGDEYRSERWYVRDRLNLLAETQEQLKKLANGSLDEYREGDATVEARLELAAERLRLFYVGVTRARRELIVTYNTGRQHEQKPLAPALVFTALQGHLSAQAG